MEVNFQHLLDIIKQVHSERADDKCWMDINRIYEAAGLPPPDNSVGNKKAMRKNCDRYIDHYCSEGGKWKTYVELEEENNDLRKQIGKLERRLADLGYYETIV